MINKNNTVLTDYGTSTAVYLKGKNEDEAYWLWVDLLNFGATGGRYTEGLKPTWVADGVIFCWSTKAKLLDYLVNRFIFRLSDSAPQKGVKGGVMAEARKLAAALFAELPWDKFRAANQFVDNYDMGTISAERPDNDFRDECLNAAFTVRESEPVVA